MAGETLESVSEESQGVKEEGLVEEDADDDGDSTVEGGGGLSHETRVTGILHDREAAKKAIDGIKERRLYRQFNSDCYAGRIRAGKFCPRRLRPEP